MCVSALPCRSEVFVDGKLGERLLALRKASGMTQEQLAEKVFVTRQAVSKWERGESVPDLDILVALSEMYGVTLDELVLGDAPRPARESIPAEERDEAFIRARKKRVFLKAALVFVLAVGVWGLLLGIVHSACLDAAPHIWIAWFTLPVVPPLVVLVAFFHYIPKELRAYFSPVPFASGLVISRFTILPIRTRRGWRSSPSLFITSPPRSTPSPSSVPANAERRIIRRKTTFKLSFRRINVAFCADFPEVVLG